MSLADTSSCRERVCVRRVYAGGYGIDGGVHGSTPPILNCLCGSQCSHACARKHRRHQGALPALERPLGHRRQS
eukprot:scaffold1335_cov102-Isochrysis_galbana.AAC.6